jgi:addiction module RelE/StbE family toxin
VNRPIIKSSAFMRTARKFIKRTPDVADDIEEALDALTRDAFAPVLRTHKLQGRLSDRWACSAGYDLRIVFKFVEHKGAEAILLVTVGTHDDVY